MAEGAEVQASRERRRKLDVEAIDSIDQFDFRYLFGYLPITDWEFAMAERFKQRFSLEECKQMYRLFERYRLLYGLEDDETLALRVFRRYLKSEFYKEEKLDDYMDECEFYTKLFLYGRLCAGQVCLGEPVTQKELRAIERLVVKMAMQEGRSQGEDEAGSRGRSGKSKKEDLFEAMFELKEGFPGRADDILVLRFLRMTYHNVADTETALRASIAWRRKFRPDLIAKPSIELDGRTAKAYWHGQDREGHPCMLVFPGRHSPSKEPVEGTVRYAVWLFEVGLRLVTEAGSDQICILYDRGSFGLSNWSTSLALELLKLQPHYPESLSRIYVLGANWVYYLGLKIVQPVMPVRTLQKITLVSNQEELRKYFSEDNLLPCHGGTSTFEFQWDTYMDDFLARYQLPWQMWHAKKRAGTLPPMELLPIELDGDESFSGSVEDDAEEEED